MKISAAGYGWQQGLHNFEGTFQGDLGAEVLKWASTRFQFPEDKRIRAPFFISQAYASWDRKNGIAFTGKCQWPKGSSVFIDLRYTPEVLTVKRMLISDDYSPADIGLEVHPKEVRLDFKGNLEGATLDRILSKNEFLAGSFRGDFHALFFIDDLLRSTAPGKLSGNRISSCPTDKRAADLK